ncbi:LysR substrate-binding domain-containing protein [Candidatus Endoriftia persephonae]|jgi:LysR family hydrogen peroxide-inducible transcriptional activator|uniref:Hydrogen peroxide-inducible genes activator n=2 Tax=Gammaproteobacteria TaxID=1236 RepID=G2FIK2_9GAMM|nr:LysR substrate-binding domain-containing protein [Candidatus Endoriftia persephone]EGW53392.1 hydrogen peroxide-inducible genes activator [endosymbiont of Tevnia jerichonana (vent Tica)]USF87105.1 LysR substrate-binding domain-containing protein [Candidatus Endoriftia persephone]
MNLRDLSYLVAVAETGHFGRAAERCFVSQPTLSNQIKKLEKSLGVTLFERTNRSVRVTPVGEVIIEHARRSIQEAEAIKHIAEGFHDPFSGPLRLGAIPTLSPYLIPLILKPLRERYPKLQLALTDEVTASLTDKLANHEIDAALLATPIKAPGYDSLLLFDEPFWLAHLSKHPLYTKDEISCEDLAEVEMLLLSDVHCLSGQIMSVCPHQRSSQEYLRAFGMETLIRLVAAGYGCTLVPALTVHGSGLIGSGVIARKLEIPTAFRRIRLVYRSSFPRKTMLQGLAQLIDEQLPNTVRRLDADME